MDEFAAPIFSDIIGTAIRKRRSQSSRRPRVDISSLSSTPPSDELSKVSSDETNGFDSNRKEINLNQCASRVSSSAIDSGKPSKRHKRVEEGINSLYYNGNKRSSEGVLAPANWKGTEKVKEESQWRARDYNYSGKNGQSVGNENKVKVKLKVGGFTRTIQTNTSSHSAKARQRKLELDDDHSSQAGGSSLSKEKGKTAEKNSFAKCDPVRKSRRVPKKRVLDGEFDDGDEDDEIRYLEKLKTSKLASAYRDEEEESNMKGQNSRVSKVRTVDERLEEVGGSSRSGKVVKKKSRPDRVMEDTDYEEEEEEEMVSDCELEGQKKKKLRKESVDSVMENKREFSLTTRQRALQSGKEASSTSLIEFPNGLPPVPPRKQKEKLSEVEQQLKKTEAAQRRRMQVEKAARESEAEAIRKILGQDSSRKKREDKIKRRQEELAQEKAATAHMLASNTIRWVMGPTGTVVTFPTDVGLPSIFDSEPCSYPPPREKCAGPSCSNPYKYRDSKSKLPLCSLQCYKAVQEMTQAESTTAESADVSRVHFDHAMYRGSN